MSSEAPTNGEINILKSLISRFQSNPSLLNAPNLKFFKDYLKNHKLPPENDDNNMPNDTEKKSTSEPKPESKQQSSSNTSQPDESDFDENAEFKFDEPEVIKEELKQEFNDGLEVIDKPDELNESEHQHTDISEDFEPAESDIEQAQAEKSKGVEALENKDYETAIKHFTGAVMKNPKSALLLAARADVFLKLKKPNAAIEDCNLALKINPDSAKAMRLRGQAYVLLGNYAKAHQDLSTAQRIDYDQSGTTQTILKKVQARVDAANKIERDYERKKQERETREKKARYDFYKRKEERRRQREEQDQQFEEFEHHGHAHGAGAGAGAAAGGAGPGGFSFPGMGNMNMPAGVEEMLSDPEVTSLLSDPKVMAGVTETMKNPNYRSSDPLVQDKLNKLMKKFAENQAKGGKK